MKVKDLREFPPFKKHMEKIMSGECDDYEVLVQLNGVPAPMTFVNIDDNVKTVWFAGNSSLEMPELFNKTPVTQEIFDSTREDTAHIIEQLDYRDKHGHWPKD